MISNASSCFDVNCEIPESFSRYPVRRASPIKARNFPLISWTNGRYLLSFLIYFKKKLEKTPIRMKGNPTPREKENSRIAPFIVFLVCDATNNIDARIGPMQGDHPKANPKPIRNDCKGEIVFLRRNGLFSISSRGSWRSSER